MAIFIYFYENFLRLQIPKWKRNNLWKVSLQFSGVKSSERSEEKKKVFEYLTSIDRFTKKGAFTKRKTDVRIEYTN